MSSTFYFLADLYPWWGIPLALILAEVGNQYRRRGQRGKFLVLMSAAAVLGSLAVVYFVENGREHLAPTIQQLKWKYLRQ